MCGKITVDYIYNSWKWIVVWENKGVASNAIAMDSWDSKFKKKKKKTQPFNKNN